MAPLRWSAGGAGTAAGPPRSPSQPVGRKRRPAEAAAGARRSLAPPPELGASPSLSSSAGRGEAEPEATRARTHLGPLCRCGAAGRPLCVWWVGGAPCGACPAAPAPVTGGPGRRVPQGKSSERRRGRAPAAYRPLVAAAAASHEVEARPPLPLRGRSAAGGRYSRGEPAPPFAASLRSRGRSAAAPPPPPPRPRSSCGCWEPRSGRNGAVTRSPAGKPPSPPPPPPPPSAPESPPLQPRGGARSACPVTPRTAASPAAAAASGGAPTRTLLSASPPSPAWGRQQRRRAQREGR
ncbi:basic salivary proline-rich protein 2-like [Pezoporus occidentalis]|uniref:basic salivary proline-rich protein 2-like n=1 Tax=Pezoporus occidentalis TaxID=407982 RepID=UPI002F91B3A6